LAFLVFFLLFLGALLLSKGFAYDSSTGTVMMEDYKYLHNLIGMPVVFILFLAGVAGVLYGIGSAMFGGSRSGIWYTGSGTLLAVTSLLLLAGFNDTAFYPSIYDLNSSLTIRNASSSHFTLKTMMFVSFIVPFVAAYIWFAWKAINDKRITEGEMKAEGHVY
jgi:cytochrome d ubiquinol oxidase subunit II